MATPAIKPGQTESCVLHVPAGTDLVEWYFEQGWTDGLPVVPPTLSISGGHNRLEFHANRLRNALTNAAIQRAMGTRTNDGLVAEESVNMYSEILPAGVTSYHPCNDYFDYTNTNHTGLVEDQHGGYRP